jgi:hypothetical protein
MTHSVTKGNKSLSSDSKTKIITKIEERNSATSLIELVIVGGKKFLISDSHKIVDIRLPDVNNSVKLGDQLGATELWLDKTMMKLCWPGNYQRVPLTMSLGSSRNL